MNSTIPTGTKMLISTDNYFGAPDGRTINRVWGPVQIMTDESLGFKTNDRGVNWFVKVGGAVDFVIIAGCQIHYAVQCNEKPTMKDVLICE